MRCPKCGFISFDNVEACLKCKKTIAASAKKFQGSVYNVAPPAFLKFGVEEDEADVDIPEGEGFEADEEFEITDPDLEILLDEDDQGEEIELSMEDGDGEVVFADEDELAGEFGEIEAFSEDSSTEDDIGLDLGMLEDSFEEETVEVQADEADRRGGFAIPDELADLSDLSPPDKSVFDDEPGPEAKRSRSDSLEAELDFGALEDELADLESSFADEQPPQKKKLSLDMDEDLDFELDLGGLSIHDDK